MSVENLKAYLTNLRNIATQQSHPVPSDEDINAGFISYPHNGNLKSLFTTMDVKGLVALLNDKSLTDDDVKLTVRLVLKHFQKIIETQVDTLYLITMLDDKGKKEVVKDVILTNTKMEAPRSWAHNVVGVLVKPEVTRERYKEMMETASLLFGGASAAMIKSKQGGYYVLYAAGNGGLTHEIAEAFIDEMGLMDSVALASFAKNYREEFQSILRYLPGLLGENFAELLVKRLACIAQALEDAQTSRVFGKTHTAHQLVQDGYLGDGRFKAVFSGVVEKAYSDTPSRTQRAWNMMHLTGDVLLGEVVVSGYNRSNTFNGNRDVKTGYAPLWLVQWRADSTSNVATDGEARQTQAAKTILAQLEGLDGNYKNTVSFAKEGVSSKKLTRH